jgi:hypothetical protein
MWTFYRALISYFFTINFNIIHPPSLFPNHFLLSGLQSKTSSTVLMRIKIASLILLDIFALVSDKQLAILDMLIYKFLHHLVTVSLTYLHVICSIALRFTKLVVNKRDYNF